MPRWVSVARSMLKGINQDHRRIDPKPERFFLTVLIWMDD